MSPAYHYARKLAGMAAAPVPIDRVKATETWLAAIAPGHPVIGYDRLTRRAARPRSRSGYGLISICRRGGRRQAGLNPSLYRTVLRRGVSWRLTPEPSRLGIGLAVDFDVRSRAESASLVLSRSVPAVLRGDPVRYRK
jgi:hypothetical protein